MTDPRAKIVWGAILMCRGQLGMDRLIRIDRPFTLEALEGLRLEMERWDPHRLMIPLVDQNELIRRIIMPLPVLRPNNRRNPDYPLRQNLDYMSTARHTFLVQDILSEDGDV